MFAQSQLNSAYLRDRYEYFMRGKQEAGSNLYNEKTFYRYFIKDMLVAKKEVVIYSPFVSKFRTDFLKKTIEKLRERNIEIFIFTRPIETYDSIMQNQIRVALERYEEMGVCVFFLPGYVHEKVAIIDREILWEGSLNILSQKASREMMRRIPEADSAMQVLSYLKLQPKLAEGYRFRYEKLCQNLITSSKENIKAKVRMFLLGMLTVITVWWLFTSLKSVVSSFQETEFIAKIVKILMDSKQR